MKAPGPSVDHPHSACRPSSLTGSQVDREEPCSSLAATSVCVGRRSLADFLGNPAVRHWARIDAVPIAIVEPGRVRSYAPSPALGPVCHGDEYEQPHRHPRRPARVAPEPSDHPLWTCCQWFCQWRCDFEVQHKQPGQGRVQVGRRYPRQLAWSRGLLIRGFGVRSPGGPPF